MRNLRTVFSVIEFIVVTAIIALLIAIIVVNAISASTPSGQPNSKHFEHRQMLFVEELLEDMIYFQCPETGIVFAVAKQRSSYDLGYGYMSIVPSDQVARIEHLIVNKGTGFLD